MGERSFRKLCLAVILSALVLYLYLYGMYETGTNIQNAFFVNTPGCRIIAMDVMNPEIAEFTDWEWNKRGFRLVCPKRTWFRTEAADGEWYLKLTRDIEQILQENDLTNVSQLACYWYYFRIQMRWATRLSRRTRMDLEFPYIVKVPQGVKQLRLKCINTMTNQSIYDDAHFFIQPPPEKLLKNDLPTLKFWKKRNQSAEETPPISVMILGLDSISHLNLLRQMPNTSEYLRSKMSHVEFWGLNKIGLNTFPNLIPLLTGKSEEETNKYWNAHRYMDALPLIWKDFKRAGYNTSFGEDHATLSMFYYAKPGFRKPITDHYLHDVMVQMHLLRDTSSMSSTYCVGDRTYTDILMEMNSRLQPHYQRHPFFSFYWWCNGLHEYLNSPRLMDGRFERLLRSLAENGITNNTLILFMSDHGLRWGKFRHTFQGMIEDSQPFVFALYPKWMGQRYPLAIQNLHGNAHSLLTNYDLYETMKHLLDLKSLEDEVISRKAKELWKSKESDPPRGISLFLPIPPWRTCNSSDIPSKFCLCHKPVSIPTDNRVVQLSAAMMIDSINKLLEEYPVCASLQLDSIVSASFETPERDFKKDYYIERGHRNEKYRDRGPSVKRSEYPNTDITLRLKTQPGNAYFEGMARRQGLVISIIGEVVRVGDDGNKNNDCIANPKLEPFCYCTL
ncbi:hypothetical protein KR009_007504 [Drosophila setifemur]|nr:hypothetical protein KR009_007504 [Drosophila setifemur]